MYGRQVKIGMLKSVLGELGLDEKEVVIFMLLLKLGSSRASVLAYQSTYPRTTVQNVLIRLEKERLVNKVVEENAFVYTAVDPENIKNLINIKKRKAESRYEKMLEDIETVMPEISSLMNSNKNLPKVQFFKGRDAMRKVLADTLTSKTELKGFTNVDAMMIHGKEINDAYVTEREKTNVKKRGILLDTPFARENHKMGIYSPKSYKAQKWVDSDLYPFSIETNIYDGKVSFITYVEDDFVGVIIENQYIYEMHESMWNLIWDLLPDSDI